MIKIISPGIYSSVQDSGRRGYRQFGMPLSGAMDPYAFNSSNRILGNMDNAAVIEITAAGFECEFSTDTTICITGADLNAVLNTKNIVWSGKVVQVSAGSYLKCMNVVDGLRAYLGVCGGIETPLYLGSRSMISGQRLKKGDELEIGKNMTSNEKCSYDNSYIQKNGEYIIKVRLGPDAGLYRRKFLKRLLSVEFVVSNYHDRMGVRLSGPELIGDFNKNIVTKPIFPGCIQLPSDGNPIIIMNDGQTTGGYPVWAVIEHEDLRIAGQLKSGDKVKFICV